MCPFWEEAREGSLAPTGFWEWGNSCKNVKQLYYQEANLKKKKWQEKQMPVKQKFKSSPPL